MDDIIAKLEEQIAVFPEGHPIRKLFEISLEKQKERKKVGAECRKSNPLSETN